MGHVVEVTPVPAAKRAWDSTFFGSSIAQVTGTRVTAGELSSAVQWASQSGIDCLYLLADADAADTVRFAEAEGFARVDERVTLERPVTAEDLAIETHRVRPARAADVPSLMALARSSHRNTRFHRDAHFDPRRSDELYAIWIERSANGEMADMVWVADEGGLARGYLTVSRAGDHASIGLVAVDESLRGQGLGSDLLRAAIRWTAEARLPRVTVVTQGSGDALRFYRRAGFTIALEQVWFHRWLREPRA